MKRSHRTLWWTVYGVGSAAVILALGWVTTRVVKLEHDEAEARGEIRLQEQVRQALWRMDSWLAPRLAREAGRTWFEYESYYPQTLAYNRLLEPMSEGAVVLPSPLLQFKSEYLPLHFQYRANTGFTSPQVPAAVYLSSDTIGCTPVPAEPERAAKLAIFAKSTSAEDLKAKLAAAERVLATSMSEEMVAPPQQVVLNDVQGRLLPDVPLPMQSESAADSSPQPANQPQPRGQTRMGSQGGYINQKVSPQQWSKMQQEAESDLKARRQSVSTAQQSSVQVADNNFQSESVGAKTSDPVYVGALVPFWLGDQPERLIIARRVRLNTDELVQGVEVNWPRLKAQLLELATDVMPGADLRPTSGLAADPAVALASLPVVIVPPAGAAVADATESAAGFAGLGLMWLAALGALGTTGLALRSTIASAVQTSRFASSVTHELRTPLTTFRLYAEMLSDGMVQDAEQRKQYLQTLRDESGRLGFLVENVLTWSRVEEGRATVEPRRMSADELVSAAEPVLRRRCDEASAKFNVDLTRDAIETSADADRVRQVLFNLVDNACKYAGERATITLSSEHQGKDLVLAVDDNGPGVPAHLRSKIFNAFDRGTRGPGDSVRGLGLGLAISRELARSLGGELACVHGANGGARFELRLPVLQEAA